MPLLLLALAGCHVPQPPPPPPTLPPGPSFEGIAWVDAAPDLRGKVALVRWWTNG